MTNGGEGLCHTDPEPFHPSPAIVSPSVRMAVPTIVIMVVMITGIITRVATMAMAAIPDTA
jgi:hypothetical protein